MAFKILYTEAVSLGINYQTGDLLNDIDSNFAQCYNTNENSYSSTFTNASLSSGILTVTHGLNTGFPKPVMRRPDGTYEDATAIMTYVSANQVTFDFSGAIAAGTWYLEIRY